MSLSLTPQEWQDIYAFQEAELIQLASDEQFARSASLTDHFSRIGAWIKPELGGRVLEVGCGPGRYVAMLASMGFDVVGVDPIPYPTWEMIKSHRQVELADKVFAEDLPFPDASFDHVACIAALLYFNDAKRSLAEIRRVLKPGGRVVIRSVSRWTLHNLIMGRPLDPATRNHYTMAEFVKLAEDAGLPVVQRFSYGFYPPIFKSRWWHATNGKISVNAQGVISALTPAPLRHQLIMFCVAPKAEGPKSA
jgi:SAM-dependent methyltransferase